MATANDQFTVPTLEEYFERIGGDPYENSWYWTNITERLDGRYEGDGEPIYTGCEGPDDDPDWLRYEPHFIFLNGPIEPTSTNYRKLCTPNVRYIGPDPNISYVKINYIGDYEKVGKQFREYCYIQSRTRQPRENIPLSAYKFKLTAINSDSWWRLENTKWIIAKDGHVKSYYYSNPVTTNNGIKKKRYIMANVCLQYHDPHDDPNRMAVHINGNKLDNRLFNLRWTTDTEQIAYNN